MRAVHDERVQRFAAKDRKKISRCGCALRQSRNVPRDLFGAERLALGFEIAHHAIVVHEFAEFLAIPAEAVRADVAVPLFVGREERGGGELQPANRFVDDCLLNAVLTGRELERARDAVELRFGFVPRFEENSFAEAIELAAEAIEREADGNRGRGFGVEREVVLRDEMRGQEVD